ncbi:MAG: primosomal protein N', partial [Candidatus Omnitrophica bacterium]|nr:primosomal protein N' [Candidatus Omnitrophota bacterium]
MLFAKVVVGLPIDVAFDYSVPHELQNNISIGSRVWVNLRNKKTVGYVVGFVPKSSIKNVKDILELIDNSPLLGKNELLLTKQISNYYCCSWGEAIETALPEGIRKGKTVSLDRDSSIATPLAPISKKETVLLHNLQPEAKWDIYVKEIQLALDNKKSAIILFADIHAAQKAKEIVDKKIGVSTEILYRKESKELDTWVRIRSCETSVVIGTRSAVFAPVNNLGLIIVDSEEDSVYKQEQVPHYHARELALMRSDFEKVKVILESRSPTLESFYLAKQGKISYQLIPRLKAAPEIKIIDTRRLSFSERKSKPMLSKFLADTVYSVLNEKGKALLFLNRKGFATYASCHNCGVALRCPRCNIALAYHFQENSLICHHCNFKMEAPEICPTCNSGYIKYSGIGTDKVESELSRIFPQARIKKIESQESAGLNDADIFVATSAVLKNENLNFDLIGILNIDNSLNRVDFRAAEKAFSLLMGLVSLTNK